MNSSRKIFFVTYGGGHVDIVLKLLPALEEMSDIETVVLALTTAAPRMELAGRSFRNCSDYIDSSGYELALEIGSKLSETTWFEGTGIKWAESCAYLGASMVDLISQYGEDDAKKRYDSDGRRAFLPLEFMRSVLLREKPDLVVTTCPARMELAAVIVARSLNIPSALIDDLFGNTMLRISPTEGNQELAPLHEWPDYLCVINDAVKRNLESLGFPASRVVALGQPVFSEWVEIYSKACFSPELEDWREEGKPIITYFGTNPMGALTEQVSSLFKFFKKNVEWGLCIKMHPSISAEEFRKVFPEQPDNVRVLYECDLAEVMKSSDVCIDRHSTTGLLSILAGKPRVELNTIGLVGPIPFSKLPGTYMVSDYGLLQETLNKALIDQGAINVGSAPAIENSPLAVRNIANWLRSLAIQ